MEDEIMTAVENTEVENGTKTELNAGVVAIVAAGVIAVGIAAFHFGKKKLAERKAKKKTVEAEPSEFEVE